ncbi:MAG: hypothetical protein IJC27_10210 [Lentisphaeria bacterium]|nr:hypothetical protein [Lentisphaeria bacterium]
MKKVQKILKLELEKMKNGGILRIRCVLSATSCLKETLIKKISKIFKSLLDKLKIGDILSNCHSDESALIEN